MIGIYMYFLGIYMIFIAYLDTSYIQTVISMDLHTSKSLLCPQAWCQIRDRATCLLRALGWNLFSKTIVNSRLMWDSKTMKHVRCCGTIYQWDGFFSIPLHSELHFLCSPMAVRPLRWQCYLYEINSWNVNISNPSGLKVHHGSSQALGNSERSTIFAASSDCAASAGSSEKEFLGWVMWERKTHEWIVGYVKYLCHLLA